jgi:hypothetical protein
MKTRSDEYITQLQRRHISTHSRYMDRKFRPTITMQTVTLQTKCIVHTAKCIQEYRLN